MVTMFLRAAAFEAEDVMSQVIAKNHDLPMQVWRVFKTKVEGKGKLPMIDERSLEAIKLQNCHINHRFFNKYVHLHRE